MNLTDCACINLSALAVAFHNASFPTGGSGRRYATPVVGSACSPDYSDGSGPGIGCGLVVSECGIGEKLLTEDLQLHAAVRMTSELFVVYPIYDTLTERHRGAGQPETRMDAFWDDEASSESRVINVS